MDLQMKRFRVLQLIVFLWFYGSHGTVCWGAVDVPKWKLKTPASQPFQGHAKDVATLKFSHSGRQFASVDFSGKIIIWDVQKKQIVGRFQLPFDRSSPVIPLEWDASDQKIVCWSDGGGAVVVDLKLMKQKTIFSRTVSLVRNDSRYSTTQSLKISSDGKFLLRGTNGIMVPQFRKKETQLKWMKKHPPVFLEVIDIKAKRTQRLDAVVPILKISLLKNGDFTAIDFKGALLTGNISRTSTKRMPRKGGESMMSTVLFGVMNTTTDGRLIAVGGTEGTLEIWQRSPLKKQQTLKVAVPKKGVEGFDSIVSSVNFSDDGKEVAVGTAGGKVQMWTLGKKTHQLREFKLNSYIINIKYAPRKRHILSILNAESQLIVFDFKRGTKFVVKSVMSFDWSPDGNRLAVTGMAGGKIVVYKID